MSSCLPCLKICPVPVCSDEIIIGTIADVNTDIYIVVHNRTTNRKEYVSSQSDAAGLVTLVTSGLGLMPEHSYELAVIPRPGSPCDKYTVTVGEFTGTCLSVSFENAKDSEGCPINFTSVTLEVETDPQPATGCLCVTQEMIDGFGGGGLTLSGTYAELTVLLAAGIDTTIYDKIYITDKRIGLFLDTSINPTFTPTLQGWYNALNADYQYVNDVANNARYASISGFVAPNLLVWHSALAPAVGNIVIWNGTHWKNLTGAVGTAPDGDAVNWVAVTPNVLNGYIAETDYCEYDFSNDLMTQRNDRRSNKVTDELGYGAIAAYQWGNNSVAGNSVENGSIITCINQRGVINDVKFESACGITLDNTNEGNIINALFIICGGTINITNGFSFIGRFTNVVFDNTLFPFSISSSDDISFYNSTLILTLDVSDISIFNAGVLTIPNVDSIGGIFILTGGNPTITEIVKPVQLTRNFRIKADTGTTVSITSGVGANQPRLIAAAGFSGIGNNGDFIDFTTVGFEIFEMSRANF